MSLFRLEGDGADARLVVAREKDIELESQLESWLENSPWALGQDEPILWIDRQTSASGDDGIIRPDLLGVDYEGNLVIAELKRDRAPREVVAQLLEYAAWAKTLSDEDIHQIGDAYFQTHGEFQAAFCEEFDTDEVPPLNRSLRLFIVAQRIPDRILKVCQFLRDSHDMDINCIVVSTFETESGDVLVTTEAKVGGEEIASVKVRRRATSQIAPQSNETPLTGGILGSGGILGYGIPVRWSDERLVRDVVLEAARELTGGDTNVEFAPKELYAHVRTNDPNFKFGTVHGQLTAACPNAPSYIHHSGDYKYYWRVRNGVYRLYDPERDEEPEDEE